MVLKSIVIEGDFPSLSPFIEKSMVKPSMVQSFLTYPSNVSMEEPVIYLNWFLRRSRESVLIHYFRIHIFIHLILINILYLFLYIIPLYSVFIGVNLGLPNHSRIKCTHSYVTIRKHVPCVILYENSYNIFTCLAWYSHACRRHVYSYSMLLQEDH